MAAVFPFLKRGRIKTIEVICDRCKQIVEVIRGEKFTAGIYDMTKWEEYRRENERYVCDSCMFADPKYLERYGSCFSPQAEKVATLRSGEKPIYNSENGAYPG